MVLRGSCWLLPTDGEPVALSVGDVVFLPNGSGYGLADSPATPLVEPRCDADAVELFASACGHHSGDALNPGFRLIGEDERQSIDWKGAGRRADPDRG